MMTDTFSSNFATDESPFPPYSHIRGNVALSAGIGLLPSLPRKRFLGLLNGTTPVDMPPIPDEAITYTATTSSRYGKEEWLGVHGGYFEEFGRSRVFADYLAALHAASRNLAPPVREHCIANIESWEIALHVADPTAAAHTREVSLNAYTLAQLDAVSALLRTPQSDATVLWTLPPEEGDDDAPEAVMGEKTAVTGASVVIDYIDYDDDEADLTPAGELPTLRVTVDRGWFVRTLGNVVDRTRDQVVRQQKALAL